MDWWWLACQNDSGKTEWIPGAESGHSPPNDATHRFAPMLATLKDILESRFAPEHASWVRMVIESPDDEKVVSEFANWLANRNESQAEWLRLKVRMKQLPFGSSERDQAYAQMRELRAQIDPVWAFLVDRRMAIPRDLCARGRQAAEIYLAIYVRDPCTLTDWRLLYSPKEWRLKKKPCPRTSLLVAHMEYEWLKRTEQTDLTEALSEHGFIEEGAGTLATAITDRLVIADNTSIDNGNGPRSWKSITAVEAYRKVGVTATYVVLQTREDMGLITPIFSTWPRFDEAVAAMTKQLSGFDASRLDSLEIGSEPAIIWKRLPST